MKKKTFGLTPNLNKGLTDTINIVENNNKMYFNAVVPLDRIEPDPQNPRKLAISVEEVKAGHLSQEGDYQQKMLELEKLTELAESLKASELINPIILYKYQDKYRIATGERRYLASILAGRTEIDARIFYVKPEQFELKLMQWFENTEREDLSLADRINNIQEIITAYLIKHPELSMTSTVIRSITGLSKTQAKYYLSMMNAPADILTAINAGKINSLDKATLILSCKDASIRQLGIEACAHGASLKELRELLVNGDHGNETTAVKINAVSDRTLPVVDLGRTYSPKVVQIIVEVMTKAPEFEKFADGFDFVNWISHKDASKAFKKLVKLIEEVHVEN